MPIEFVQVAGVPVSDLDRALAFYTEKLGFEKHTDQSLGDGFRWVTVRAKDDNTQVQLDLNPDRAGSGGAPALAFAASDVEATAAELKERGVEFRSDPEVQEWGGTMATFLDQDGNMLVLHSPQD